MLPSYFDYAFVHLRQKVCLRPESSPQFLSTLGPNPVRIRTRPEKSGPTYNSDSEKPSNSKAESVFPLTTRYCKKQFFFKAGKGSRRKKTFTSLIVLLKFLVHSFYKDCRNETTTRVSAQSFFTCSYLESNLYLCCVSLQGYFFTKTRIFTFMHCCEQQEILACCVAKLHLICI